MRYDCNPIMVYTGVNILISRHLHFRPLVHAFVWKRYRKVSVSTLFLKYYDGVKAHLPWHKANLRKSCDFDKQLYTSNCDQEISH